MSTQTLVPRSDLVAIPGSPFLSNAGPRRRACTLMLVGAGVALFGGIGGGQGLLPWFAASLLLGGVVGFLVGLIHLPSATPAVQYCPDCLTPMGYGAFVCPHDDKPGHPRRPA